jgi:nitroimidazol reductase NimA-like FMN-containing flavoprotein (pyridoxamine 5'-phosphate oxidase superfamily)
VKDLNKKLKVLKRMMEKYQPEGNDGEIPIEILKQTAVIEISIDEITAKENLG